MTLQNSPKYIHTLSILAIALLHENDVSATPVNANEINAVTSINFSVDSNHLAQLKIPVTATQLSERVIANLSEWHYPLQQAAPNASHNLVASLGEISHESTPVGFSFSRGNSDPRSAEFQKANVLPITCTLSTKGSTLPPITHKMTFSTEAFFSGFTDTHTTDKLVDQITTTCFTLLDNLKTPLIDKPAQTTTFKPAWMPSVQVVVKPIKPTVAQAINPEPLSGKTAIGKEPILIKTEAVDEANTEVDKELIINNQGSPLTLHLGHERR
ncbi:MAG: hypothetical protein NTY69_07440 [Methylococcales bacterium]|nr:hypothetical protein [Methylococcales bacterium]